MSSVRGRWIRRVTRYRIYERDRWRCVYCGEHRRRLSLDHYQGRSNAATNLVTACLSCNSAKQGKTVRQWYAFLRSTRRVNTNALQKRVRRAMARTLPTITIKDVKMSFRKQAQVALGMDAPRIMRKDMTTITELIAKYQGIEAALNATKFEESAEVVSGVAQPLMQARGMLELALEKLTESNAPTLAGISPEESETAQNVAFALEDQLMAYLEETKKKPSEVRVKPELFALLQEAWPGVTELPFAGGKITLIEAGPNQAADFVFDARASS